MITLGILEWSNCFSYGPNNRIDLQASPVTQIIGFNGTGKSSIPLIIEEVLYNKNSKGMKKTSIPNRYIGSGYSISLTFFEGVDEYKVSISRKTAIKVKLEKNGEDISSHTATDTYKTIQDILGLDFKTFSQLVYQNPNSSLQFLTATDTNRKKFLIDLLSLEVYVKLFEVFKEAAKASTTKVTSLSASVAIIEKWLSENIQIDTTVLPLQIIEKISEEDEKLLKQLSITFENIAEKNKKIKNNNQKLLELSKIDLVENDKIPAVEKLSYDSYQTSMGKYGAELEAAKRELPKLRSLRDQCPTCDQNIDQEFKKGLLDTQISIMDTCDGKIQVLNEKIDSIKKNNALWAKKQEVQRNWEDLYRSIDHTLEKELIDKDQIENQINEVTNKLRDARMRIQKQERANEEIYKNNTRAKLVLEQKDKFIEQLAKAKIDLDLAKDEDANLEVLKKTFSTNGLVAYKIETLVKELENETNKYLAELSDGRFTIEFVVVNDKLDVIIGDNNNSISIEDLSSGELARVNTATLLAIRSLMSTISKSRINILFLDEVINVLDSDGRERLIEVLLKEDNLNTFIVSHGYSHPLLDKLEVVKEDNISRIDNG